MIKTIFFDVGDVLLKKRVNIEKAIAEHLGVSFENYLHALNEYIQTDEAKDGWQNIRTLEKEVAYMEEFAVRVMEKLKIEPSTEKIEFIVTTRVKRDYELVEGTYETLDYLQAHYRLGVISNSLVSRRHYELKEFDLEKYFDPIILSREIDADKPGNKIFHLALELANVKAEESALIDNKLENLEAAHQLGFAQCILYNCNNVIQDKFSSITRLEQLLSIF